MGIARARHWPQVGLGREGISLRRELAKGHWQAVGMDG